MTADELARLLAAPAPRFLIELDVPMENRALLAADQLHHFERGLLLWNKTGHPQAVELMREALAVLGSLQQQDVARQFCWLAEGALETCRDRDPGTRDLLMQLGREVRRLAAQTFVLPEILALSLWQRISVSGGGEVAEAVRRHLTRQLEALVAEAAAEPPLLATEAPATDEFVLELDHPELEPLLHATAPELPLLEPVAGLAAPPDIPELAEVVPELTVELPSPGQPATPAAPEQAGPAAGAASLADEPAPELPVPDPLPVPEPAAGPDIEATLTAFEAVSPEDFPSLADEVVPDLHEPVGQAPVAAPSPEAVAEAMTGWQPESGAMPLEDEPAPGLPLPDPLPAPEPAVGPGIEDLLTAFETVSPEDFPSLADEVVPDLHEPAGQAPVAIPAATPLADWTEPELPVLEEVPVLDMAAEPGSGPMPGTFEPVDPESFPSLMDEADAVADEPGAAPEALHPAGLPDFPELALDMLAEPEPAGMTPEIPELVLPMDDAAGEMPPAAPAGDSVPDMLDIPDLVLADMLPEPVVAAAEEVAVPELDLTFEALPAGPAAAVMPEAGQAVAEAVPAEADDLLPLLSDFDLPELVTEAEPALPPGGAGVESALPSGMPDDMEWPVVEDILPAVATPATPPLPEPEPEPEPEPVLPVSERVSVLPSALPRQALVQEPHPDVAVFAALTGALQSNWQRIANGSALQFGLFHDALTTLIEGLPVLGEPELTRLAQVLLQRAEDLPVSGPTPAEAGLTAAALATLDRCLLGWPRLGEAERAALQAHSEALAPEAPEAPEAEAVPEAGMPLVAPVSPPVAEAPIPVDALPSAAGSPLRQADSPSNEAVERAALAMLAPASLERLTQGRARALQAGIDAGLVEDARELARTAREAHEAELAGLAQAFADALDASAHDPAPVLEIGADVLAVLADMVHSLQQGEAPEGAPDLVEVLQALTPAVRHGTL